MVFLKADDDALKRANCERIHYILLLDQSGSMSCNDENHNSRWENLKSSVRTFM